MDIYLEVSPNCTFLLRVFANFFWSSSAPKSKSLDAKQICVDNKKPIKTLEFSTLDELRKLEVSFFKQH